MLGMYGKGAGEEGGDSSHCASYIAVMILAFNLGILLFFFICLISFATPFPNMAQWSSSSSTLAAICFKTTSFCSSISLLSVVDFLLLTGCLLAALVLALLDTGEDALESAGEGEAGDNGVPGVGV